MPTVLTVGDFKSTDQTDEGNIVTKKGTRSARKKAIRKGFEELFQDRRETLTSTMGKGQGQELRPVTESSGGFESLVQFLDTALRDLGGTERTEPDRGTDLESTIKTRIVLVGTHDLDLSGRQSPTVALTRPSRRAKDFPDSILETPTESGIYKRVGNFFINAG